ncbi:hypothetical protein HAP94_00400, partial [Acidithiobacillus ferrivorans]|nr:hypothetical protein [Acidithiobacillus ferrivorans]
MPSENQVIHFELFRYQLLPLTRNVQREMFQDERFLAINTVEELKARKNEIFGHVLEDFPSLQYRQAEINHKVDVESPPWFVVEINTQKSLKREKPDFKQERIDTWPHVIAIINNKPDVQIIAVSRNIRAFSSGAVVAKILQENLGRILQRYLLSFQVDALFEKSEFWHLVEEYKNRIISVNFELISPNMANISKGLELDLARLNADTNSHRTDLRLNSLEGSALEINQRNPLLGTSKNLPISAIYDKIQPVEYYGVCRMTPRKSAIKTDLFAAD